MKKTLVLAMNMALGITASAYAANPFVDFTTNVLMVYKEAMAKILS